MRTARVVLIAVLPLLVGCESLKKLTNGPEGTPPPPVETWTSAPAVGEAPSFNIALASGAVRTVYHGRLAAGNQVTVAAVPHQILHVFVKDAAGWFKIKSFESGAYWFTFTAGATVVQYHGQWVGGLEYCIYQDVLP